MMGYALPQQQTKEGVAVPEGKPGYTVPSGIKRDFVVPMTPQPVYDSII